MDFIPAQESSLFIKGFRLYTWLLFKRRFKKVWLKQEYSPCSECKTVYYLNHHSWWDGLIPFLLNEFRFHQQARALMEDKQMREYPFFQKIGAFSINRDNPRNALPSLRYAVQSFERDQASLFIYPEGTITPAGSSMNFEKGLTWLHKRLNEVDFVPVGIYMHTIRHDKPELHLQVGRPAKINDKTTGDERTRHFENTLDSILDELHTTAGFDDSEFERFV
ncbi:lysophospholipid acyltransferase family protein [Fodinibius saliphilus]|uniref:lysophospholipid acyltransferase family protein n=1 Tax=Fodinibius saliphilus TaxID=1920650 RepID=UPI00110A0037|nr:lysophospholipid acyltransferase family protein [Fodinibius saliphilus]